MNHDENHGNDYNAQRVVFDILETLEDMRVQHGMPYNATLSQIDGKQRLGVTVWEKQSPANTYLNPGHDDWHDGLLQPIVSETSRTINGEAIPAYGWVMYDDNDQESLHRLLGLLMIIKGNPYNAADKPF
jgi:hypothetical protein